MAQTGMKPINESKKIIIGITGGAGSGKSTIVEELKKHYDIDFMHCDIIAHELMEPGRPTYKALVKEYGAEILSDGVGSAIDRKKLTDSVSRHSDGFEGLNALTHPGVIREVKNRIKASDKAIIIIEAALLIEAGMTKMCDDVWYIYADTKERIARMKASRGWSDEKINITLSHQLSHQEFLSNTTFTVTNHDGDKKGPEDAVKRVEFLLDRK